LIWIHIANEHPHPHVL